MGVGSARRGSHRRRARRGRSVPLIGVAVAVTVLLLGVLMVLHARGGSTTTSAAHPVPTSAAGPQGALTPEPSSDEFNGASLDTAKWDVYDGPGNAGNGTRSPAAVTEHDGLLTINGSADAVSGGLSDLAPQRYGRWEVRMRTAPEPGASGLPYHPVLLLWPADGGGGVTAGGTGGELDFAEADTGSGLMTAHMHPPSGGKQQQYTRPLDLAQWHTYAIQWTPTTISGWIDGTPWYSTSTPALQPGGPMNLAIQLDANEPSGLVPATMDVDWVHIYPPDSSP